MNDVEYILYLQMKRARAYDDKISKYQEIEEKIYTNMIPSVTYDTVRSKNSLPGNYIESLMIQLENAKFKVSEINVQNDAFQQFIEPLKELRRTSSESFLIGQRRYRTFDLYHTVSPDYKAAGDPFRLQASQVKKFVSDAAELLNAHYVGVDLQSSFPSLFEIPIFS